ncbi:MAG: trimethylamine methyltransferase family protein [Syntrophaceae bacterium]|nr:trimethylamine methyltransferase family protein [Syntrophaceae bacterium]
MLETRRPKLDMLSQSFIDQIVSEALEVLGKTGVLVENDEALRLLGDAGCECKGQTVLFKENLVKESLKTTPHSIKMYDRSGDLAMNLEGDAIHFDPGSGALRILDPVTLEERDPVTSDLIRFATLTDALPNLAAQSTEMISFDVPKAMQDRYRLYIGLQFCKKPIVTGTFTMESFEIMKDMLVAVRGSEGALREKPLAIFDCCPSPPLKWSNLTCQNLIDASKAGIPAELISMPLTGATSPVTLAGALVQLTAENLSGIVIHQLAHPGSPIIFGGSPAAFDMRKGTTPMGAVETMMINAAHVQIGKHLGLPTHAYLGQSDAKIVDGQAGLETGMSALVAALAGANVISGPGMLDFESCQSLEKLILDNEICGMALRMVRGIEARGDRLGGDLYGDIYKGDHFLASEETLRWFRNELDQAGSVIDRDTYDVWKSHGKKSAWDRACEEVERVMSSYTVEPLPDDALKALMSIMKDDAQRMGIDLPPLD